MDPQGSKTSIDKQFASQATLTTAQLNTFRNDMEREFEKNPDCRFTMRPAEKFIYTEELSLDKVFHRAIDMSRQDSKIKQMLMKLKFGCTGGLFPEQKRKPN